METLTYMHKNGQFIEKGQEKDPNILKRGLILGTSPLYDGELTIVSRVNREDFQGPISDIFCVREVRTKTPILLKVNHNKTNNKDEENPVVFPLDFISEEIQAIHKELVSKKYEGIVSRSMTERISSPWRPDYYESIIYTTHNSDRGVEIGIDPREGKSPGIIDRLNGVELEARVIVRAWAHGQSPTAIYKDAEPMYTTRNVMEMIKDKRFIEQRLPQIAEQTLNESLVHLPKTENLGRYMVLWGLG